MVSEEFLCRRKEKQLQYCTSETSMRIMTAKPYEFCGGTMMLLTPCLDKGNGEKGREGKMRNKLPCLVKLFGEGR